MLMTYTVMYKTLTGPDGSDTTELEEFESLRLASYRMDELKEDTNVWFAKNLTTGDSYSDDAPERNGNHA